jgi:hypothetical protein
MRGTVGLHTKQESGGESSMKSPWKSFSGVVLGVMAALMLIAPGLQAGPAAQDRFNLPFDVQWGKMTLPTGAYTLSIDRFSMSGKVLISQGSKGIEMVLPQTFDYTQNQSKKAELVCIRHDGVVTVRALRLPQVGTFYFSLPKSLRTMMAEQPQMIETVSLAVSGE